MKFEKKFKIQSTNLLSFIAFFDQLKQLLLKFAILFLVLSARGEGNLQRRLVLAVQFLQLLFQRRYLFP